MKKQLSGFLAIVAASVFIMVGCQDSSMFPGFKQTDNGLYCKMIRQTDDTLSPKITDIVTVTMEYGVDDSVYFASKMMPQAMKIGLMEPAFNGDFMEGILMMHKGDSAEFIMSTDSVFKYVFRSPVPPTMDSIDNMWFRVGLVDVTTKEQAEMERQKENEAFIVAEKADRDAYLLKEKITVEPTATGLYFILEKKGKGKKAEVGKKVKVHYTGYTLDGTKFDSSLDRGEPIEFPLGEGRVITGWDEGVGMMRVGDKAKLIIPSSIGYGERGAGAVIKPFSTLMFEVELVGVE
jgi:FKBP-type peptidyl-prolyl cis-trans isomerase